MSDRAMQKKPDRFSKPIWSDLRINDKEFNLLKRSSTKASLLRRSDRTKQKDEGLAFLFRIYQVVQINYFTAIFCVIIQHFVNFPFIVTRNTI